MDRSKHNRTQRTQRHGAGRTRLRSGVHSLSHHTAVATEHGSRSFNRDVTPGRGSPQREFRQVHQQPKSIERSTGDGESYSVVSYCKKNSQTNLDTESGYYEKEKLERERNKSCLPAAALFRDCQMSIAVSEPIWIYMKEYHYKEIMHIFDVVKGQQDEVILIVRFPSFDDFLRKFEIPFRELYERLTSELTVAQFNMTEDFEAIRHRLRMKFQCVPYWTTSQDYMYVICHKADRAPISDLVNKHATSSPHSRLPAKQVSISLFESSGYLLDNGVRIYLHMNDIISMATDAITSPSNCWLDNTGGLARNIFTAAGPEVEAECKQIIERLRRCLHVGEVVHTKGGRLAAKYILHVTGPQRLDVWTKYIERQCHTDLVKVFMNLLIYAEEHGFKTIAIPPISTGVFRVPYQLVARVAHEVTEVMLNLKHVSEVHFVDVSEEFLSELQILFMKDVKARHLAEISRDEVISRTTSHFKQIPANAQMSPDAEEMSSSYKERRKLVTETYYAEATSGPGLRFQTKQFLVYRSVNVILMKCDITTMDVDVIVNPTNPSLSQDRGLGYMVKQEAGPKYAESCREILQHHQCLSVSDVFKVPAGNLSCKHVYVAVSPCWSYTDETLQTECLFKLSTTFKNVFAEARNSNINSLACPAIGGGACCIPIRYIANILFDVLLEELKQSCLQEVYIVDINDDALQDIYALFSSKTIKSQFEEITEEDQSLAEFVVRNEPAEDKEMKSKQGRQDSERRKLKEKREKITSKEHKHMLSNTKGPDSEEDGNRLQKGKVQKDSKLTTEKNHPNRKEEVEITEGLSGVSTKEKRSSSEGVDKQEKAISERLEQSEANAHNSNGIKDGRGKDVKQVGSTSSRDRHEEVKPPASTENCAICLDEVNEPKTLSCKHTFCKECIDQMFRKCQQQCPCCGRRYGQREGDQPEGSMSVRYSKSSLPGYESFGTIEITYSIPDGIQGPNHPNPGQLYTGTCRTAYLPDSREGRQILALLRRAFDAKLIFTIGVSVTTGAKNVVVWNDVHHKTSKYGGPTRYGYPDPNYLSRVRRELADKGIE